MTLKRTCDFCGTELKGKIKTVELSQWEVDENMVKDSGETDYESDVCGKCYSKIQNFLEGLEKESKPKKKVRPPIPLTA